MDNKQNVFSFYLDESLWFKEGQGVRELMGISLEPVVTIEDLGDEVRLTGTVELTGEYLPTHENEKYDDFPSIETVRIMDKVEKGDDGVFNFSHSFPVEITVPLERVSNMDDVLIDIETFDYEIPADNQMRLHAHLNINGIKQEKEEEENKLPDSFDEPATVGPVAFNDTDDQEDEQSPANPERDAPVIQLNNDTPDNEEDQDSEEEDEEGEEEEGRWVYQKKSQSIPEFFEQETTKEVSSESTSEWNPSSMPESHEYPPIKEGSQDESAESVNSIKQIFKHLFPNREDSYTQMKMYIVQEEETLDSIADKYAVSVKQLERANDKSEISAGEIVYIPN